MRKAINNGSNLIYVAYSGKVSAIIAIKDKMRDNMRKAINNIRYQGVDDILLLTGDLEGKVSAIIAIKDKMRDNMRKAINNIRYQGVDDILLLTGDLENQAKEVATLMGVDRYKAELLPKDKADEVLKYQANGSRVMMVGDGINDAPALEVATLMGVDRYKAELLPKDKADEVLKYQANGSRVMMVGDGINDAPALAYSDVGIALGGGSTDVAMEAADITIQGDNPMMLPTIIDLSKKTMKVVKENFGMVIGINSVGLLQWKQRILQYREITL